MMPVAMVGRDGEVVSNLPRKTGSASRTEAVLWAVRRRPTSPVR